MKRILWYFEFRTVLEAIMKRDSRNWAIQVVLGTTVLKEIGRFANPRDICDILKARAGWTCRNIRRPGEGHGGETFEHKDGMVVRAGRKVIFKSLSLKELP